MGELDRASLVRNQANINTRIDQVSEAVGGHAKQIAQQQRQLGQHDGRIAALNASLTDTIIDLNAQITKLQLDIDDLRRPWWKRLFSPVRPTEA